MKKIIYQIAAVTLLVILAGTIPMQPMKAQAQIPGLNFGGRIVSTFPCLCSGGVDLFIAPPKPASVIFQGGFSMIYSYYNLLPGPNTIGSYLPGGICLIPNPEETPPCIPAPVVYVGTISTYPLGIGTSVI